MIWNFCIVQKSSLIDYEKFFETFLIKKFLTKRFISHQNWMAKLSVAKTVQVHEKFTEDSFNVI